MMTWREEKGRGRPEGVWRKGEERRATGKKEKEEGGSIEASRNGMSPFATGASRAAANPTPRSACSLFIYQGSNGSLLADMQVHTQRHCRPNTASRTYLPIA